MELSLPNIHGTLSHLNPTSLFKSDSAEGNDGVILSQPVSGPADMSPE